MVMIQFLVPLSLPDPRLSPTKRCGLFSLLLSLSRTLRPPWRTTEKRCCVTSKTSQSRQLGFHWLSLCSWAWALGAALCRLIRHQLPWGLAPDLASSHRETTEAERGAQRTLQILQPQPSSFLAEAMDTVEQTQARKTVNVTNDVLR